LLTSDDDEDDVGGFMVVDEATTDDDDNELPATLRLAPRARAPESPIQMVFRNDRDTVHLPGASDTLAENCAALVRAGGTLSIHPEIGVPTAMRYLEALVYQSHVRELGMTEETMNAIGMISTIREPVSTTGLLPSQILGAVCAVIQMATTSESEERRDLEYILVSQLRDQGFNCAMGLMTRLVETFSGHPVLQREIGIRQAAGSSLYVPVSTILGERAVQFRDSMLPQTPDEFRRFVARDFGNMMDREDVRRRIDEFAEAFDESDV
jgi:hypothetical protein